MKNIFQNTFLTASLAAISASGWSDTAQPLNECTVVLSEQTSELIEFNAKSGKSSLDDYCLPREDGNGCDFDKDPCSIVDVYSDGKEIDDSIFSVPFLITSDPQYAWVRIVGVNGANLSQLPSNQNLEFVCSPTEELARQDKFCHSPIAALNVGQPLPEPYLSTPRFTADYFRKLLPVANQVAHHPIALGATVYYDVVRFDSPEAFYNMPPLKQSTLVLFDFPNSADHSSAITPLEDVRSFASDTPLRFDAFLNTVSEPDHKEEEIKRRLAPYFRHLAGEDVASITDPEALEEHVTLAEIYFGSAVIATLAKPSVRPSMFVASLSEHPVELTNNDDKYAGTLFFQVPGNLTIQNVVMKYSPELSGTINLDDLPSAISVGSQSQVTLINSQLEYAENVIPLSGRDNKLLLVRSKFSQK